MTKKKPRKPSSPVKRITDAAWRFIFDQTGSQARNWRKNEERFADVVRRVLREVARG